MKINTVRILFLLIIGCFSNYFCYSQKNDPIKDKFLIVLDVQEYYTSNKLSESAAQNFIDSVIYVINNTDSNHVIYIKSIHELLNLSLSFPYVYISFDTSAMRLDNRMNLVNEHVFTKTAASAFTIKALNDFLKQNNAKEIIIIGLMAEECVYESFLAGKELGYDMYMIPEAIIGKSQESKDDVIKELTNEGVKILDINMPNIE